MFFFKEKINTNQYGQFFFLNIFTITFLFIFFQSFFGASEKTDYLIFFFSILLFEITYILLAKKIINIHLNSRYNFLLFLLLIIGFLVIWNYTNYFLLETLLLFLSIFISIFLFLIYFTNEKKITLNNENLIYFFLSIGFIGFFYEFNLNNAIEYFSILSIVFLVLLKKKYNNLIDFILSAFFFIIFFKVFLLSSAKDDFHYSWYLGPINSIINGGELLIDTVSQYGYLNLLLIKYLSLLLNLSPEIVLTGIIILFLTFFFLIFFISIKKNIELSSFLTIVFLAFLLFANFGYAELRGSIFIPSASVYRFLPSIIFFLLLHTLDFNKKNKFFDIIICSFFFQVSFFWSFESAIYTLLPLFGSIIFCLLYNYNQSKLFFNKKTFLTFFLNLIIIFLVFYKKDIKFFYEYAINFLDSSASVAFNFNKFDFLFFSIISISFLFWRTSLGMGLNILFKNTNLFLLILIYSTIFLSRSHPNNLFTLLPFLIFLICKYEVEYKNLIKFVLFSLFYFTLTSTLFSIHKNYSKFNSNLLSKNFFQLPIYNEVIFSDKLLEVFKKNSPIPVTIFTGQTIHIANNNLKSSGFGLPILPIEQFNLLDYNRKIEIYNQIFKKENKHIIACVNKCHFYNSEKDRKSWEDIFIPSNFKIIKVTSDFYNSKEQSLYLVESNKN